MDCRICWAIGTSSVRSPSGRGDGTRMVIRYRGQKNGQTAVEATIPLIPMPPR